MNLLIHDLACAIERDATGSQLERDPMPGSRAAWNAEWQVRLDEAPVEPRRRLRPRDE